jgi:DNA primase
MDTTQIDLLNLIQQDVKLKKTASTNGGEWAGPCPFCGGSKHTGRSDRFRVWPNPPGGSPRYWCRQCHASGDAISYVMHRDKVDFRAACNRLGLDAPQQVSRPQRLNVGQPPAPACRGIVARRKDYAALTCPDWQHEADLFVTRCWEALWLESGGQLSPGRDYLRQRGLSDNTIGAFELGYNPAPYRATWGETAIFVPMGIVIPHEYSGQLWSLNTRRTDGRMPKYIRAKGSANSLFVRSKITTRTTVVMVEGELDAISLWQATRRLSADIQQPIVPVATGSTDGGLLREWVVRLGVARRIILAFDADDAGDNAARRWHRAFPTAARLRPMRHDVNDMLRAGDDVSRWLMIAFEESKEGIYEYQS